MTRARHKTHKTAEILFKILGMSKILLKTQAVKNFVDGQQNS
jgi:hypothetical protein